MKVLHVLCPPAATEKTLVDVPKNVPSDTISESHFWERVEKGEGDQCWIWRGGKDGDGYGKYYHAGKRKLAHRIAFTLTKGPIPAGMEVLHSCDNPPCVNPAHLAAGTHKRNMQERDGRGRGPRGQRNGRAKLTVEKVLEIRSEVKPRPCALSRRFGVSVPVIRDILNRVTWRGVEPVEQVALTGGVA